LNWSGRLAFYKYKVPLILGVTLDLRLSLGVYAFMKASAGTCGLQAETNVMPTIGLDVIGSTALDATLLKAEVSVDAKLMYTDLDAYTKLTVIPIEWCAGLKMKQQRMGARFDLSVNARTKVEYCGKYPCGLSWCILGHFSVRL
jgi:hypothetical protein